MTTRLCEQSTEIAKLTLKLNARLSSGSLKSSYARERQVQENKEDLFNTSSLEQVSEQNEQLNKMRTGFKLKTKHKQT